MNILLVEDNKMISDLVAWGLFKNNYQVHQAHSIDSAENILKNFKFNLILLDLGLPDGDGISWIKKIRQRESLALVPVIVITARGDLNDRIVGLDTGADDYLVKPFEIDELLARTRAVLRRHGRGGSAVLSVGNVELDVAAWKLSVGGRAIVMTRRKMALLQILMSRDGSVVARETLEQSLYSADAEFTPNALEVLVSRLRRRLVDAGANLSIHTVRGIGYLLRLDPA